MKDSEFDLQKQKVLSRRRRIIFNNDGGDAKRAGDDLDDPRDFLNLRTTPLQDSHVDTVSYCTSRGFGVFIHNSEVGTVSKSNEGVTSALIASGTDPLEVMEEYCHARDMEIFWSMRMNDTHDGSRPERFKKNRFKVENRDCLLGSPEDPPKHGMWSAVDYGCGKVREMAQKFVEEVCRNYSVDGIELDFFRHPVFFKKTAAGCEVEQVECDQMTELMSSIRKITEAEGKRRGRPFIIAVRTPDDLGYCRTIGLELEKWMRQELIDIYIPSAYFRMNTWEYSVDLGHRYGVRVYPGLSESRVGGGHHTHRLRSSDECYRGRAMNAWNSGADGIYIFNLFDPHRKIWWELGEPDELHTMDKLYFPSVRGTGSAAGGAYPHEDFICIPTLNPDEPRILEHGKKEEVDIAVGEDPEEGKPDIRLFVVLRPLPDDPGKLEVTLNERILEGQPGEEGVEYRADPADVRAGVNTAGILYRGEMEAIKLCDLRISISYSGSPLDDTGYLNSTREMM